MDSEYFKQLMQHYPTYKELTNKIEVLKSTDPVKFAFCSGFGSGFLVGCTVGLRNLILLGMGSFATYYCYTNYGH